MEHPVDPRRERLLGRMVLAALVWAVLSVVSGGRNWIYTYACDPYFDRWSWWLSAAWLVSLLVLNLCLYRARSRSAERVLLWYWGISAALSGGSLLAAVALDVSGLLRLLVWLTLLITPFYPLLTMSFALAERFAWDHGTAHVAVSGAVCLAEFLYLLWLYWRPAQKAKEVDHGPADL